uniref:Ribosomal_S7 domain-containing protein n=1 Tax=Macrostomum lignano TaxID=282301 RepID=A0A1I8FJW2_9PLAT
IVNPKRQRPSTRRIVAFITQRWLPAPNALPRATNPQRFQLAALKHAIMRHRMQHLQYSPPYQPKRKGLYFTLKRLCNVHYRKFVFCGLSSLHKANIAILLETASSTDRTKRVRAAILWLESSSRVVMNAAMLGRAVQLAKQTGAMIFGASTFVRDNIMLWLYSAA